MVFRKRPRPRQRGLKDLRGAFGSGSESEDEEDGRRRAAEVLEKRHARERAEGERAAQAMDGFGLEEEKPTPAQLAAPRESRYIAALKKKSQERKMENEMVVERKVQKEREAEGDMFKEKEKFVTSGYRAHLAERKEWEQRQAEIDQRAEVEPNMESFYRSVLQSGLVENAPGAIPAANAPVASTSQQSKPANPASPIIQGSPPDGQTKPESSESIEERQVRLSARRNTDTSIAAARLRYLERQKARALSSKIPAF